jgi:hypothetical protein
LLLTAHFVEDCLSPSEKRGASSADSAYEWRSLKPEKGSRPGVLPYFVDTKYEKPFVTFAKSKDEVLVLGRKNIKFGFFYKKNI